MLLLLLKKQLRSGMCGEGKRKTTRRRAKERGKADILLAY